MGVPLLRTQVADDSFFFSEPLRQVHPVRPGSTEVPLVSPRTTQADSRVSSPPGLLQSPSPPLSPPNESPSLTPSCTLSRTLPLLPVTSQHPGSRNLDPVSLLWVLPSPSNCPTNTVSLPRGIELPFYPQVILLSPYPSPFTTILPNHSCPRGPLPLPPRRSLTRESFPSPKSDPGRRIIPHSVRHHIKPLV